MQYWRNILYIHTDLEKHLHEYLLAVFKCGLRDTISTGCSALHAKILITPWEIKHIYFQVICSL